MACFICPLCDARYESRGSGDSPVQCAACESAFGRVVECVRQPETPVENAIATPRDAAIARVGTATTGGFCEGLPPMPLPTDAERPIGWRFPWASAVLVGLILIVLVGLFTPAVRKVREASARTQSTNNLKNLVLSAHGFHDANKRLPFNGTKPAIGGDATSGSWVFMMLPYLDEKPMFDREDRSHGLPALLCPGRGRPLMCNDEGNAGAWSDFCINPFLNSTIGQADAPDKKVTLVSITDGTSNTIFCGHGRLRSEHYTLTSATRGFTATIFTGGSEGTCRGNPNVVMARDANDAQPGEWGGPFPQGCLMAMGDGTVRMFPYSLAGGTIDSMGMSNSISTVAPFLTPNGGEVSALCGGDKGD